MHKINLGCPRIPYCTPHRCLPKHSQGTKPVANRRYRHWKTIKVGVYHQKRWKLLSQPRKLNAQNSRVRVYDLWLWKSWAWHAQRTKVVLKETPPQASRCCVAAKLGARCHQHVGCSEQNPRTCCQTLRKKTFIRCLWNLTLAEREP